VSYLLVLKKKLGQGKKPQPNIEGKVSYIFVLKKKPGQGKKGEVE